MAAGIITYASRLDGRIKARALVIIIEQEPNNEELELYMQSRMNANEYLIDSSFAFIDDVTKAHICAEG